MSNFPRMKAGRKDYEAPLDEFDWPAAERKAAVRFDPAAVRAAKALVVKAKAADLTDARAKTGVVGGDLVFRIKHGNSKHFGKGDIVLVPAFSGITADAPVSKKGRDQGELRSVKARNPLTYEWWSATLNGARETRLTNAITEYGLAVDAVSDDDRLTEEVDRLAETVRELERGLAEARARFTARNDQAILDRLDLAIQAAARSAANEASMHANDIRAVTEEVAAALHAQLDHSVRELELAVNQLRSELEQDDDIPSLERSLRRAESQHEVALSWVNRESVMQTVASLGARRRIYASDVPMGPIKPIVVEGRRRLEAAGQALRAFRENLDAQLTAGVEGDDLPELRSHAERLRIGSTSIQKIATTVNSLVDSYFFGTSGGFTIFQWLDSLERSVEGWRRDQAFVSGRLRTLLADAEGPRANLLRTLVDAVDVMVPDVDRAAGQIQYAHEFLDGFPAHVQTQLEARVATLEGLVAQVEAAERFLEETLASEGDLVEVRRRAARLGEELGSARNDRLGTRENVLPYYKIDLTLITWARKFNVPGLDRLRPLQALLHGDGDESLSGRIAAVKERTRAGHEAPS